MSEMNITGNTRKMVQLASAFIILYTIYRKTSFETAVLFGLAMNSADLNETREKLAGWN